MKIQSKVLLRQIFLKFQKAFSLQILIFQCLKLPSFQVVYSLQIRDLKLLNKGLSTILEETKASSNLYKHIKCEANRPGNSPQKNKIYPLSLIKINPRLLIMTFLQNQDLKYFVCFKTKAYTLKNPYEPTSHHFQVDSLFKWQTEVCS